MNLKELTWKNHQRAERSWFARLMFSGQISDQDYANYLKQQYICYNALEKRFDSLSGDVSFPDSGLKRADSINEDLLELCAEPDSIPILKVTDDYTDYILNQCPEHLLYAHVYVRYLGDLKGGQMISKRVPGSGKYYQFNNPEILEGKIRAILRDDDDFVSEANKCFNYANDLFDQLQVHIESKQTTAE